MMCREALTDIKIEYAVTGGHEPCKKSKESKETQLDFHNADVYFDLLANK